MRRPRRSSRRRRSSSSAWSTSTSSSAATTPAGAAPGRSSSAATAPSAAPLSASIAIVNVPVPGHVNPTLPVVRELVRRGHRVRYFTSDALSGAVATAGAEVVSYGEAVGPQVMRPPRSFAGLARETVALGRILLPAVLDELRAD